MLNIVGTPKTKLSVETMNEIKSKYNAREMKVGKDLYILFPDYSDAPGDLGQYKLNRFTRTIDNTVNLQAYGIARGLGRFADIAFRMQQYAAYPTNDTGVLAAHDMEAYDAERRVLVAVNEEENQPEIATHFVKNIRTVVNLPYGFANYNYTISNPQTDLSADCHLLFFAYIPDLAKEDQDTVPSVVQKYFLNLLGSSASDCLEMMENIRAAWGVIRNTEWGKCMTHVFKCIEISFETQCGIRPYITDGTYYGCFIAGGAYHISVANKVYIPQPRDLVVTACNEKLPHANAWARVKKLLDDLFDEETIKEIESTRDIHNLLLTEGNNYESKDLLLLRSEMGKCTLPKDKYLTPNISNIMLVLECIQQNKARSDVPMHSSMIGTLDPIECWMSAFGPTAPSFLVPGGRKMSLDKPFESTIKKQGTDSVKNVNKVACYLVPLNQAVLDMKKVLEEKYIMNPFANAITRASTTAIVKTFEGGQCIDIVSRLRDLAGVSVAEVQKRAREDDMEEGPSEKRSRAFEE